jgi:hypothetical protein
MTETEEEVLERVLENTRDILKILERMNRDTEKVLEEKED